MDAKKESLIILKSQGRRVRNNRHEMWRLNEQLITVTQSRTDRRGWINKLAEIRRALKGQDVSKAHVRFR